MGHQAIGRGTRDRGQSSEAAQWGEIQHQGTGGQNRILIKSLMSSVTRVSVSSPVKLVKNVFLPHSPGLRKHFTKHKVIIQVDKIVFIMENVKKRQMYANRDNIRRLHSTRFHFLKMSHQCGSAGCVSSHRVKGCWFDSRSGHMPGLGV